MKPLHVPNKVLLVILDGWGQNPETEGNAIALANTLVFDRLSSKYPNTTLVASGSAIDLPPGHMGNSEVGHQNIGAGRVVPQASSTITRTIISGTFFDGRRIIPKAMAAAKRRGSKVHLFGLLSDGLVHSHINHAIALIKLAHDIRVDYIVHALLDGRDVPPRSAKKYLGILNKVMEDCPDGVIGSVTGRLIYERDHEKWQLVKQLYDLLVLSKGKPVQTAEAAVDDAYSAGVTIDEHIPPYVIVDRRSKPVGKMENNDLLINWNFRGDRATMISHALMDPNFQHFKRHNHLKLNYICMSLYDDNIPAPVAFPPIKMKQVLSDVISNHGLYQFKTAETTKFYHLTFFFNCRRLRPFWGETQVVIPSKKTEHYDEIPEMSAPEVAESIIGALNSNKYQFLAVNFANPDMVGHTGNLDATIRAVQAVDQNLGKVIKSAQEQGYTTIVTADHGNADYMVDLKNNIPVTAHSASDVPFILIPGSQFTPPRGLKVSGKIELMKCGEGLLGSIAPTILALLDIEKPQVMTGESLLTKC
jgi:2,3-bisphosphoglycerate-independent phosphoglycerate mutase